MHAARSLCAPSQLENEADKDEGESTETHHESEPFDNASKLQTSLSSGPEANVSTPLLTLWEMRKGIGYALFVLNNSYVQIS
jgi:hypothetical protein